MVSFDAVTYLIGPNLLLGPLNMAIQGTGVTTILGANGAGKSLLLKLCHGLIAPSTGLVLWDGIATLPSRGQRGFMFQQTPIMRRSVAANVEFPLLTRAIPRRERAKLVAAALDSAGLGDKATLPAAALSGGERQRMALARAMVVRPQVLLLDEPSASLDPQSTATLETMIREAAQSGVGVLLATHDWSQAQRLAGEVVLLENGLVAAHENAVNFFTAERMAARC